MLILVISLFVLVLSVFILICEKSFDKPQLEIKELNVYWGDNGKTAIIKEDINYTTEMKICNITSKTCEVVN